MHIYQNAIKNISIKPLKIILHNLAEAEAEQKPEPAVELVQDEVPQEEAPQAEVQAVQPEPQTQQGWLLSCNYYKRLSQICLKINSKVILNSN